MRDDLRIMLATWFAIMSVLFSALAVIVYVDAQEEDEPKTMTIEVHTTYGPTTNATEPGHTENRTDDLGATSRMTRG